MNKSRITVSEYISPCGVLILGSDSSSLCMCDWKNGRHGNPIERALRRNSDVTIETGISPIILQAMEQLDEYFAGTRKEFTVSISYTGTEFQNGVWEGIRRILYGQTLSYMELACGVGRQNAVRAVANACGSNVLSIFVPCHRVIGRNGTLTGYAGGIPAKQFLLRLEKSKEHRSLRQNQFPQV